MAWLCRFSFHGWYLVIEDKSSALGVDSLKEKRKQTLNTAWVRDCIPHEKGAKRNELLILVMGNNFKGY